MPPYLTGRFRPTGLDPKIRLLPQILQEEGYATHMVGNQFCVLVICLLLDWQMASWILQCVLSSHQQRVPIIFWTIVSGDDVDVKR